MVLTLELGPLSGLLHLGAYADFMYNEAGRFVYSLLACLHALVSASSWWPRVVLPFPSTASCSSGRVDLTTGQFSTAALLSPSR